jgi:hypothetical protein
MGAKVVVIVVEVVVVGVVVLVEVPFLLRLTASSAMKNVGGRELMAIGKYMVRTRWGLMKSSSAAVGVMMRWVVVVVVVAAAATALVALVDANGMVTGEGRPVFQMMTINMGTILQVVALLVSQFTWVGRQGFEAPNSVLSQIRDDGGWPVPIQMMTVSRWWTVPLYAGIVVVVALLPAKMTRNE